MKKIPLYKNLPNYLFVYTGRITLSQNTILEYLRNPQNTNRWLQSLKGVYKNDYSKYHGDKCIGCIRLTSYISA